MIEASSFLVVTNALGAKQRGASKIIGVDLSPDKFEIGFFYLILLDFFPSNM